MKGIAPPIQGHGTEPMVLRGSMPSAPDCESAFQAIARSCLHLIQSNRKAAIAADPEAIHIMRIELTRLRAAMLFFSPMTGDDTWPGIDEEIHWLNSTLGKARDHDVTANYARRKRYRRWAKSSRRAIMHARRKVDRRLSKKLASAWCDRLMTTVHRWITDGPWLMTGRSIRSERIDAYSHARLQVRRG
jgi:CHAD domain-containing protein